MKPVHVSGVMKPVHDIRRLDIVHDDRVDDVDGSDYFASTDQRTCLRDKPTNL